MYQGYAVNIRINIEIYDSVWTFFSLNIPDCTAFLVTQESPPVGHRQWGAVCDPDLFTSLCVVEHTAKIHCGGGEVQVGEVHLGVQLHQVLLWVSLVVDFKVLENNVKEVNMFAKNS